MSNHLKPRILFVGNYNRDDYVRLLEASKNHCSFYFLFFASLTEEKSNMYQEYGEAIYWKNFQSAQQLLKSIAPDKVVFLYIESYNHVVLNLACREAVIPTYLLEHGLRADYVIGFDPEISPKREHSFKSKITHLYHVIRDLPARMKSRTFLNKSISLLSPENRAFMNEFIDIRSKHNYLNTFRKIKSDKRIADHYIAFSSKIYDAFREHEAPYFGGKVKFIGIPYFDRLAMFKPAIPSRSMLLIDQPLAEQRLLQWDIKYKETFAQELCNLCNKHQYHLYIKPHPEQDVNIWQKLERQSLCVLIDDDMLQQISSSIPLVLGFYSTYLMPFAAYQHTTLITLENHPAGRLMVSKPLVEAGVAHAITDLKELNGLFQNIEKIHQQQLPNKAKFTEEWMYKFDGKSGERLRDILLSETF